VTIAVYEEESNFEILFFLNRGVKEAVNAFRNKILELRHRVSNSVSLSSAGSAITPVIRHMLAFSSLSQRSGIGLSIFFFDSSSDSSNTFGL
jgi:hypothetical protein